MLKINTLWMLLLMGASLMAQTFDSGSDGSDGALVLDTPGIFLFSRDAFDPALDEDGDGVFHFTTIDIAADVIVKFPNFGGPVRWLASGDVNIQGTLDLRGEKGHPASEMDNIVNSVPGPGGFAGGKGSSVVFAEPGYGPGGGKLSGLAHGGGGGHQFVGGTGTDPNTGGSAYGNRFLLPLIGGSGGAGSKRNTIGNSFGSGGGAGGGAILLASSTTITIDGSILADGGDAGENGFVGGGGSGGAIRIVGSAVAGGGLLSVAGGQSGKGRGSAGRIRVEAHTKTFNGTLRPSGNFGSPGILFLSPEQMPIRITAIDGVEVPATPHGGFSPADIQISNPSPVTIEIEGRGVPLGTVVDLTLIPESGAPISITSTPLSGSTNQSTATATVTIPFGFSHFYVQAEWNP